MDPNPNPGDHGSTSTIEQIQKKKTLERNDAEWESIKDDIFRIYMAENNTLSVTMFMIEQLHHFNRSPRKWKEKLKQWDFVKNLTMIEVKAVVTKAEKRAREDGKDTIFLHRGNIIPPEKVSNLMKRMASVTASPATFNMRTPATIAYFTPRHSTMATNSERFEEPHVPGTARKMIIVDERWRHGSLLTKLPEDFMPEFFVYTTDEEYLTPQHNVQNDSNADLKYSNLEVRNIFICRFRPAFLHLLSDAVGVPDSHTGFYEIVELIMQSETEDSILSRLLLDRLGRTLIKDTDIATAILLATSMSKPLYLKYPSISPELLLGYWYYCNGLFKESIPYIEDAFLHDLDTSSKSHYQSWLPPNLPAPAPAELLRRSYLELGPSREWLRISERVRNTAQKPFF